MPESKDYSCDRSYTHETLTKDRKKSTEQISYKLVLIWRIGFFAIGNYYKHSHLAIDSFTIWILFYQHAIRFSIFSQTQIPLRLIYQTDYSQVPLLWDEEAQLFLLF